LTAQERARIKSLLGSIPAISTTERAPQTCVVSDSRGARSPTETTPTRINPVSTSALVPTMPLPFPDRTVHLCARRFLATCLQLKSRLQCVVESVSHPSSSLDNPEPFFLSMYLVNADEGCRVSEEFYWNPNTATVDSMIPAELFRNLAWTQVTVDSDLLPSEANAIRNSINGPHKSARGPAPPPPSQPPTGSAAPISADRVRNCRSAVFSVPSCLNNLDHIYLVVRVDKVLNGTISGAAEKYTKGVLASGPTTTTSNASVDNKAACLLSRSMGVYCRHLGRYRMPFAWGARSLCSSTHRMPLFKIDASRITESAFMQQIQSLARLMDNALGGPRNGISGSPEHMASIATETNSRGTVPLDVVERTLKTQAIPMTLDLAISELVDQSTDSSVQQVTDLVTPSLCPVKTGQLAGDKKYLIPPTHPTLTPNELVREVEHFFDIRSVPAAGVGTDSVMCSSVGETDLAGQSGSLHRLSALSMTGGSGARSNRDSVISSCSTGSVQSPLDSAVWTAAISSTTSTASTRTNSLERSSSRAHANPADLGTGNRYTVTNGIDMVPFTTFQNDLYVSPKSLNLAVKHNFSRARNLSCFVELRCNDSLDSTAALKQIANALLYVCSEVDLGARVIPENAQIRIHR
uniref:C2 DOCK-type domain-containing protein n=1 Tax=Echinostoma caproni TaxID=27848 RepID=A0A183AVY5_9TREM